MRLFMKRLIGASQYDIVCSCFKRACLISLPTVYWTSKRVYHFINLLFFACLFGDMYEFSFLLLQSAPFQQFHMERMELFLIDLYLPRRN